MTKVKPVFATNDFKAVWHIDTEAEELADRNASLSSSGSYVRA